MSLIPGRGMIKTDDICVAKSKGIEPRTQKRNHLSKSSHPRLGQSFFPIYIFLDRRQLFGPGLVRAFKANRVFSVFRGRKQEKSKFRNLIRLVSFQVSRQKLAVMTDCLEPKMDLTFQGLCISKNLVSFKPNAQHRGSVGASHSDTLGSNMSPCCQILALDKCERVKDF